jgi:hypothetical protein
LLDSDEGVIDGKKPYFLSPYWAGQEFDKRNLPRFEKADLSHILSTLLGKDCEEEEKNLANLVFQKLFWLSPSGCLIDFSPIDSRFDRSTSIPSGSHGEGYIWTTSTTTPDELWFRVRVYYFDEKWACIRLVPGQNKKFPFLCRRK